MDKAIINPDMLLAVMTKKGYKIYQDIWRPNIIGIRTADPTPNVFNDFLVNLYWSVMGEPMWAWRVFEITTDPGNYWLENPPNVEGTAILAPGQYIDSYAIGLHKGQYEALVQVGNVKVFRDRNKDDYLDYDASTLEEGLFGINIHHAAMTHRSQNVDKWSAGCQVFADAGQYTDFMNFCTPRSLHNGNGFSYTLLTENDLL